MRGPVIAVLLVAAVVTACNVRSTGPAPIPSPTTAGFSGGIVLSGPQPWRGNSVAGIAAVNFPPRNEPFDFRQQLEVKYRDGLRRGAVQTFVDLEGDIVWTQEYLRYRVNACDHQSAI